MEVTLWTDTKLGLIMDYYGKVNVFLCLAQHHATNSYPVLNCIL